VISIFFIHFLKQHKHHGGEACNAKHHTSVGAKIQARQQKSKLQATALANRKAKKQHYHMPKFYKHAANNT
jgi:hypothetical protein